MQIMYCYIEPWVIDQNVYLMSDGIEPVSLDKVPLENVAEYLAIKYGEHNCDKIILHGSNYAYNLEYEKNIKDYCLTKYGLNNINIEVIKQ